MNGILPVPQAAQAPAPFDLAGTFPTVASVEISYLQSTPGDGYPSASSTWDPSQGDKLDCSNGACLKGGVWINMLLAPIVAAGQAKAVRKKQCSGQERMHADGFRPCPNIFMLAVTLAFSPRVD